MLNYGKTNLRPTQFRKGLPNETQCYSLVNLTPSDVFRILHIE
jgi:hypothetical protein